MPKRSNLLVFVLLLSVFQFSHADIYYDLAKLPIAKKVYDLPDKGDMLVKHNRPNAVPLKKGQTFNVLTWNIQKNKDGDPLPALSELTEENEIVLVQESILKREIEDFFTSFVDSAWLTAVSFLNKNKVPNGVSSGSRFNIFDPLAIRSRPREPVIKTPKMILSFNIPIAGAEESLLVANIHAINFVSIRKYRNHIKQLVEVIENHNGPVLAAGDFNTWNKDRHQYLDQSLGDMGVFRARMANDTRRLKLDHIYLRGLKSNKARVLYDYDHSDHYPLQAELTL